MQLITIIRLTALHFNTLFFSLLINSLHDCSCGSVVEHCVSSAKVVGSIPREHMYWQKYV